jgi:hypothetical protein
MRQILPFSPARVLAGTRSCRRQHLLHRDRGPGPKGRMSASSRPSWRRFPQVAFLRVAKSVPLHLEAGVWSGVRNTNECSQTLHEAQAAALL